MCGAPATSASFPACPNAGVAAGVRRIEALTGTAARKAAHNAVQLAKAASSELKVTLEELPARVASLLDERKKLERDLADAQEAGDGRRRAGRRQRRRAQRRRHQALGPRGLRRRHQGPEGLADEGKKQVGSGVVAIVSTTEEGKAGLVVGVTADLSSRFNAIDLVRKGAEALGGKGGGGRPDLAQAGGPDGSKADEALEAIGARLRSVGRSLSSRAQRRAAPPHIDKASAGGAEATCRHGRRPPI